MGRRSATTRVEYGDWQTPVELADQVVSLLAGQSNLSPTTVIEPTCGEGSFLRAAGRRWPNASLRGFDVNPVHVETARRALAAHPNADVIVSDFFTTHWETVVRESRGELLFLGNPPWVTSSELGSIGSVNLPKKDNFKGLKGLDAITGKSNFDVSEWMLLRLLAACSGQACTIAMLCKAAVARRLMEHCAADRLNVAGEFRVIDARQHFGASVDAVLLVMRVSPARSTSSNIAWPIFADLTSISASSWIGVIGGTLTSDVDEFQRTEQFLGASGLEWRSGLKHDCSRVMEFAADGGGLINGDGDAADIEPDLVYPLLKGSDVANGRLLARRRVLVPQRTLGQDTGYIARTLPKTWAYLDRHRNALDGRKSSIYLKQPPFSVFGVGDYTFAPWKLAICGLYKRLAFRLVGPHDGKPVVFDDTCYFLPFQSEVEARRMFDVYTSEEATRFFESRIFWDSKRPISKAVLQSLDPRKVAHMLGAEDVASAPSSAQQRLFGLAAK